MHTISNAQVRYLVHNIKRGSTTTPLLILNELHLEQPFRQGFLTLAKSINEKLQNAHIYPCIEKGLTTRQIETLGVTEVFHDSLYPVRKTLRQNPDLATRSTLRKKNKKKRFTL